MLISQLPAAYKELALKRMAEFWWDHRQIEDVSLTGAFSWARTPEGGWFWHQVNLGILPPVNPDTAALPTASPITMEYPDEQEIEWSDDDDNEEDEGEYDDQLIH